MMNRLAKRFVLNTACDKIILNFMESSSTTVMALFDRSKFCIAILLQNNLLASLAKFV